MSWPWGEQDAQGQPRHGEVRRASWRAVTSLTRTTELVADLREAQVLNTR
ncbi:hypothetical protein SFR_6971 (plasmid) [Streptomyces sp. FR-008]|nr:hypothetical protein SFR_6971 [Streptomyces sp. FR-008]